VANKSQDVSSGFRTKLRVNDASLSALSGQLKLQGCSYLNSKIGGDRLMVTQKDVRVTGIRDLLHR
jgi:hypothetical protein